ncbi:type IV toxin-antitoxin system AbiEi family antitoxin domain-containing protein (plasmid) [Methylocaldum sp. MU1018]|jgi:predicted transcriptional regulator of viral defense system
MDIRTAVTLEIGQLHQPVVTSYQLGCLIFHLYQTKVYRGEKLNRIQKDVPERLEYNRLITSLVRDGILQNSRDVPNKEVFVVLGQNMAAAEDIACCVDPFGYISHLSAMEYHGLTDRLPKILFLTTPSSPHWGQLAIQRMQKDLGLEGFDLYSQASLPLLRRLRLAKIHRKTVNVHTSVHCGPGAYVSMHGRPLRVATIGRTFLDMIREPDLCGGIYHVLDVYADYAGRYLRLIVDEVDRHGSKLDKVRVGYILDERLGLTHPTIKSWHALVQRGGSQKLLAQAAYSAHFSEKWCLSINIAEAEEV